MAPAQAAYSRDERVLCFHHELLYEAKVLDSKPADPKDKNGPQLWKIHYKGWKNTWDSWVPEDRLRKFSDENRELAANLKREMDALRRPPPKVQTKRKGSVGDNSARNSEERGTGPRGQKRGRDNDTEREEHFHSRPSIRLPVPDNLKSYLVDDWENISKNLQLVTLPSKSPVNNVLAAYYEQEKTRRREGSADADILEEIVQGVREYFRRCLGKILLYRFEREQYFHINKSLTSGKGEFANKDVGDVYGPEHLCRLFVSMPELIAQTNMDQQSVARLRDELTKLTQWLSRNSDTYFRGEYENASQEYIEKVKNM